MDSTCQSDLRTRSRRCLKRPRLGYISESKMQTSYQASYRIIEMTKNPREIQVLHDSHDLSSEKAITKVA